MPVPFVLGETLSLCLLVQCSSRSLVGLSFDDWFGYESSILKSPVTGYQDHPDILRLSVLVYESGHLKSAAYALAAVVASLWTAHLLIVQRSFLISCDSFWFEVCFIRYQDSYANWFHCYSPEDCFPSFGSQPLSFRISELCFLETTDSWISLFFFLNPVTNLLIFPGDFRSFAFIIERCLSITAMFACFLVRLLFVPYFFSINEGLLDLTESYLSLPYF